MLYNILLISCIYISSSYSISSGLGRIQNDHSNNLYQPHVVPTVDPRIRRIYFSSFTNLAPMSSIEVEELLVNIINYQYLDDVTKKEIQFCVRNREELSLYAKSSSIQLLLDKYLLNKSYLPDNVRWKLYNIRTAYAYSHISILNYAILVNEVFKTLRSVDDLYPKPI